MGFLRFKKEVILPRPVRTDNPYKKNHNSYPLQLETETSLVNYGLKQPLDKILQNT